ncbi:MAG: peptide ABC transporter substrate-binding protein [Tissierellia bacterium]|nr:peptide ABC transporter substrate-binding protein [Tissierellia bacterium]
MRRLVVFILSIFIFLWGCSPKEYKKVPVALESNKSVATRGTEKLQDFRYLYSGEVTTLNYLKTNSSNEIGIASNLVDSLVEYDKFGLIKPALAIDWEVSEDNMVWTFILRQGVNWYTVDGYAFAEVLAQDFVDSAKYILDLNNDSSTANIVYGVIKNAEKYYRGDITDFSQVGVKAIDNYKLEYTLEKPVPYFLSMITHACFLPINGEFLKEVGDKFGTDNYNFLYNGAYILDTFEPQSRRVLIANDNYWDKEHVYIKKIVGRYNKEALTLAPELFIRGEVDSAKVSSIVLDEWINNPEREKQIRPNRANYFSYFYSFNFNPNFAEKFEPDNWELAVNNLAFRKAIFHGFNRKAAVLTEEPYSPNNRLLNTITPKNFLDFEGTDYTQLGSLADISHTDSFNKELALEYKEKAIDELKGIACFPVKVLMPYNTGSVEWASRAQVIEQQLENILGIDFIDIIIDARPPTGFLSKTRRSGDYSILECNWGPDFADPETYTTPFGPDGTYNYPHLALGYEEDNGKSIYENMLNIAKREVYNMGKRYKLFAEAEAFLINQAFVIPYSVGSGGYSASRLNPFESQYSPYGISSSKFKGQKIMEKPMNTEQFNESQKQWEIERRKALKAGNR